MVADNLTDKGEGGEARAPQPGESYQGVRPPLYGNLLGERSKGRKFPTWVVWP